MLIKSFANEIYLLFSFVFFSSYVLKFFLLKKNKKRYEINKIRLC
jgi:hypothetical protein